MGPLALTNGHGRYTTATPERKLVSTGIREWPLRVAYNRYKFMAVSFPKRLRNGRFASETATWIQKRLKKSKAEAMGVVIGICVKYPAGADISDVE